MRVTRVKVTGQRSTAVIKRRTPHLASGAVLDVPTPAGVTAALPRVEFPVLVQPSKIPAMGISDDRRAGHRVAPPIPQACLEGSNVTITHGAAIASGRSKSSRR